jgi:transaldolase
VLARRIDAEPQAASRAWDDIAAAGVDLAGVAAQLEREGVSSFQKSFDELIGALGAKAAALSE